MRPVPVLPDYGIGRDGGQEMDEEKMEKTGERVRR